MKNKMILLIIATVLFTSVFSQPGKTKIYGGQGQDIGYSFCFDYNNSEWYFAGSTSSFGADTSLYILNTNEFGDTVHTSEFGDTIGYGWMKHYGKPVKSVGKSVVYSSMGKGQGVIYTGGYTTDGTDKDLYFTKIAGPIGDTIFTRKIRLSNQDDQINKLYVDPNASTDPVIGVGSAYHSGQKKMFFALFNNFNGDTAKVKYFTGGTESAAFDYASESGIQIAKKGQSFMAAAIAGYTETGGTDQRDAYIVHINSFIDGIDNYTVIHGGEGNQEARAIAYNSKEDEYIVAGISNSSTTMGTDIFLMGIDNVTGGGINWEKTITRPGNQEIYDLEFIVYPQKMGGDYIVVTGYTDEKGDKDAFVMAIDISSGGEEIWTQLIGEPAKDEIAYDIRSEECFYYIIGSKNNGTDDNLFFTSFADSSLTLDFHTYPPSCPGYSDGALKVIASGGMPNYNFEWKSDLFNEAFAYNDSVIGLQANKYYAVVTDHFGCIKVDSVILYDPEALKAEITDSVMGCHGLNDKSATVTISGGTPPYSILWNDSQITETAVNLSSGEYSVQVTDDGNCSANSNDNIIIFDPDTLTLSFNATDANCSGECNGIAVALVTGGSGSGTYSYDWGNENTNDTLAGLCEGIYYLNVTDSFGCSLYDSVKIKEPQALSVDSTNVFDLLCHNNFTGQFIVYTSGGTPAYQYDINGTPQTDSIFKGLSAGKYPYTVTDAHGCIKKDTVTLGEPDTLYIDNLEFTDIICRGDSNATITVSASGGTGNFSFSTGLINPKPSGDFTDLASGTYQITITDENNCSITSANIIFKNPDTLVLVLNPTDATCDADNGAIDLTVTGGWGKYLYSWSEGSSVQDIANLSEGWYIVELSDSAGCTQKDSALIGKLPASLIKGTIAYSGGLFDTNQVYVELFLDTSTVGAAELLLVQCIVNSHAGYFEFPDVLPGNYVIRIKTIEPEKYPDLSPTYYDSTFNWKTAVILPVKCDTLYNLTIKMYEIIPPSGGPGIIKGNISYKNMKKGGRGEPVPNSDIFIEQEPDDKPVKKTRSDDDGNFILDSIPTGDNYSLYVDIPGFPLISTHDNINITNFDTLLANMDFYVDTTDNGGIYIDTTGLIICCGPNSDNYFLIYPNPFSDQLHIHYILKQTEQVSIGIYDMQGRKTEAILNRKQEKGEYSFIWENTLSQGIYYIKFSSGNTIYLKKLIRL